jgi:TPP-dependent pyruvate/acetoin dehydrogenase alpha subunit
LQNTYLFEGRQEQTWLFEGVLPSGQAVVVDGREILSVSTVAPSAVLASRGGLPCLIDYLTSKI